MVSMGIRDRRISIVRRAWEKGWCSLRCDLHSGLEHVHSANLLAEGQVIRLPRTHDPIRRQLYEGGTKALSAICELLARLNRWINLKIVLTRSTHMWVEGVEALRRSAHELEDVMN